MLSYQPGQLVDGFWLASVDQGAQPVQVPALAEQFGQLPCGVPVAGVGLGTQDLLSLVQVATLAQQFGQLLGGASVTCAGQGTQSVQVPAFAQQPDQLLRAVLIARLSQDPQHLDGPVQIAALAEQTGQLPCGVPVAGVGSGTQDLLSLV